MLIAALMFGLNVAVALTAEPAISPPVVDSANATTSPVPCPDSERPAPFSTSPSRNALTRLPETAFARAVPTPSSPPVAACARAVASLSERALIAIAPVASIVACGSTCACTVALLVALAVMKLPATIPPPEPRAVEVAPELLWIASTVTAPLDKLTLPMNASMFGVIVAVEVV